VLARQQGEALAITATNNGTASASVSVDLPAGVRATLFMDALTGATSTAENGRITLVVPAMFGTVLVAR
jgi:hypothetical protein